jgi:hypothetical protein
MPTGPDILKPTISRMPPALSTTSDMADVMAQVKAAATTETPAPAAPEAPMVTPPVGAPEPAPAPEPSPAPAPPPAAAADEVEDAEVVRKPWFVKKIDKLNEKARAAEAKLATEAAERARLEAEVAALRAPPPAPKPEDDPAPAKNDFPDPDAYTAEFAAWTARQEVRKLQDSQRADYEKRTREAADARANDSIKAMHEAHNARVAKAKVDLPDFEAVALRDDVIVPIPVFAEIERSEMSPQLMYAIGKTPDLAKELTAAYGTPTNMFEHQSALSRVVRKLTEIEHTIRDTAARTVTNAKEPIEPIKSGSGSSPKSPEDMTMDEYYAQHPSTLAQHRPFAPVMRRKT